MKIVGIIVGLLATLFGALILAAGLSGGHLTKGAVIAAGVIICSYGCVIIALMRKPE